MTTDFDLMLRTQVAFEEATVHREELAQARNRLIAQAYAEGRSQREISRLLGITQAAVHFAIVRTEEELIAIQPSGSHPRTLRAADLRKNAIRRRRRAAKRAAQKAEDHLHQ